MRTFKGRVKCTILLLFLTLLVFITSSALSSAEASSGNDYYVAPNGDDSNPGTIDQPWRTLAPVHARDFLPGDVIHFKRGGVWSGGLVINDTGVEDNPIIFTSYGTGNRPIFTSPGGPESNSPVVVRADWIIVEGLFVQDAYAAGVYISIGSDHNVIRDIEATDTGYGIAIYGQHNLVTDNYLHDLHMIVNTPGGDDDYGAIGIVLFNSNNEVSYNTMVNCKAPSYDYGIDGGAVEWYGFADNNYVHHNWATGGNAFLEVGGGSAINTIVAYNVSINNGGFSSIQLSGPFASYVENFRIENNTIVETSTDYQGYEVLNFAGEPTWNTALVRNNIFWIERGTGIWGGLQRISDSQGFTHVHNLYQLVGEMSIGFDLSQGEMIIDPMLVNLEGRDFHLQPESPAIDSGMDLGYSFDYDDNPVPLGAAPDVGAFEYRTVPTPGDFDGDGDTDITVYHWHATYGQQWYIKDQGTYSWGNETSIPVPADYDGDGDTDIAVYDNGTWYVKDQGVYYWGDADSVPVPGDYDGDGDADIAVIDFHPSWGLLWYIKDQPTHSWGNAASLPVQADYNGDGMTDVAVYNDGLWYIESIGVFGWGNAASTPLPGDYDGDGDADLAVYIVESGTGVWYKQGQPTVWWGGPDSIPVPGDYNGDGITDLAVFDNGTWYVTAVLTYTWGGPGDYPLPAPDYDGDGDPY